MNVKLLLFSDLHLEAPFAWLAGQRDAARRRRQQLRETLVRIVDLALAERVEALLCGGDLYENELWTPDTAAFLQQQLDRLAPRRVFLAPGNHDWLGPDSLYRRTAWGAHVHLFDTDRLAPVALADGLTLWGAAHLRPAGTAGFLEGFRVDRGGVHLALFHGSETGWWAEQEDGRRKEPHAPFRAEQLAAAGLHHAFLGHYHRPRDAERFTYPGNPAPLTFGEDGERGAVLAEVAADGSVRRSRRAVGVGRAHDLRLDVTGAASRQEILARLRDLVAGLDGVARLTVGGDLDPEVDLAAGDLAAAAPELDGLLVRFVGLRVAYDLEAIAAEPTVRGQFARAVLADPELADEDERRRVLVTGLRALDGRDDLLVP